MAAIAISLHLCPNRHRILLQIPTTTTSTTTSLHFFSSSSSSSNDHQNQNQTQPQSELDSSSPSSSASTTTSSFLRSIRANLKQTSPPLQQPRRPPSSNAIPEAGQSPSSRIPSLDIIRKSLSGSSSIRSPTNSFQESYKRNVERNADPGFNNNATKTGPIQLGNIRASLKRLTQSQQQQQPRPTFDKDRGGSNFSQQMPSMAIAKDDEGSGSSTIRFSTMYSHDKLGEKLRELRPEVRADKKNWFSLAELNERLKKLREIEKKEADSKPYDTFSALKEGIAKMNEDVAKKNATQRSRIFNLVGTPNYISSPPKETLVEKYFHPDHMSSADKMKLELKKVREKFKTSESDCGSTPVQVAQLTTKIKHLASALHKKDKHSRKGLQAMVQRRKRLLKYLRRTDWDSYCHVLSELGLRDSPDYKT